MTLTEEARGAVAFADVRTGSSRVPTRGLSLPQLWALSAVALFAIKSWFSSIAGSDFWWHLAMGRVIVHSGIPAVDTYSWTEAARRFFDQNWLAEVGFYAVYRIGGVALIVFLTGVAVGSMAWLLFKACRRRTASLRTIAFVLVVLVGLGSISNLGVRPQTFTYPIFAAFLLLLGPSRRYRASTRWLWLLPALMVLWVNVHGSFALGVFLVGAALFGDLVQNAWTHRTIRGGWELAPVFAATAAATLMNPHGLHVYGYIASLTGNDAVRSVISEWAPPTLGGLPGIALALAVGILVVSLIARRTRPAPQDLAVVVGLLPLALMAQRNVVWFCMAAAPLAASQLAPRAKSASAEQPAPGNRIMVAALVAVALLALPWVRTELLDGQYRILSAPRPQPAALRVIDATAPKRLFNEMSYGGYLMFADPRIRVFIDPRVELYPKDQVLDYARLTHGPDVETLVAKYRFDAMLVSATSQPRLVQALEHSSNWRLIYRDSGTRYYSRTVTEHVASPSNVPT